MKRFFYVAVAAGLLMASGCGDKNKQENQADSISTEMTDEELARAEEEAVRELAKIIAEEAADMPMAANELDDMDEDAFDFDMASLSDAEKQQLVEWEREAMEWARQQEQATLAANVEGESFEPIQFEEGIADVDGSSEVMAHNIDAAREAIDAGKQVVIQGHADAEGDENISLALSEQRAEKVKDALVAAGLPAESIQTAGYSNALPVQWGTDGSEVNRRAELVVVS